MKCHAEMCDKESGLLTFIADNAIRVLNVAGSRASKEPEVYQLVKQTLENAMFARLDGWVGGPGEG